MKVMWSDVQTRVGTPHKALEQLGRGHRTKYLFKKIHMVGWVGGRFFQDIIPLRGSILQAGTCKILILAENPRWSRVWQYDNLGNTAYTTPSMGSSATLTPEKASPTPDGSPSTVLTDKFGKYDELDNDDQVLCNSE